MEAAPPRASRAGRLLWLPLWAWHMLSLDAPTVALAWAWLMARTAHVALHSTDLAILGIGTWLVYVADRLLDGLPGRDPSQLRERHLFHARWRYAMLAVAVVAALLMTALIAFRMRPELRRADAGIFALAMIYFAIVHGRRETPLAGWGKAVVVGILFAAAGAAPAWTASHGSFGVLGASTVLLAALCWLNCAAIEQWESTSPQPGALRIPAAALALVSGAAACAAGLRAPGLSVAASALALLALDSTRVSPQKLRVLADLALLTPLFALLW
jgi:hypothetical protein